jgi:hypothetical protein
MLSLSKHGVGFFNGLLGACRRKTRAEAIGEGRRLL